MVDDLLKRHLLDGRSLKEVEWLLGPGVRTEHLPQHYQDRLGMVGNSPGFRCHGEGILPEDRLTLVWYGKRQTASSIVAVRWGYLPLMMLQRSFSGNAVYR